MSETFPELPRGFSASARGLVVSAVFVLTFLSGIIYWSLGPSVRGGRNVQQFFETHDLPKPTAASVWSGEYTQKLERWAKVGAPPIVMLGSQMNALNWTLGLDGPLGAVDKPGDWTFFGVTLLEVNPEFRREARRQLLQRLGERAKQLGVQVLVVVGPDKSRLYDDIAFEGRGMPPGRARFLDVLGDDFEAAGLELLDPTPALRALRKRVPSEQLYLRRDTHWLPLAATHVAALVEQKLEIDVSGAITRPILWRRGQSIPADLFLEWRGLDEKGFLGTRFRERREFAWTHAQDPGGVLPDKYDQPVEDAPLLIAGDSFSDQGFVQGLLARLPIAIDASLVKGGSDPYENLDRALLAIEEGRSKAQAIVVLGVERQFTTLPPSMVPPLAAEESR